MKIRQLPMIITLAFALALLVYGPVAQLANYHQFADQSVLLTIPHAGDVLSNLGFAIVGLIGLLLLWPHAGHPALRDGWAGYRLFLISLVLTAIGSTWYHLAPDNTRLIFDRLPIALACAGLLAAVRAETRPGPGAALTTVLLAGAALISVTWWALTEHWRSLLGVGDLRPYLMLQLLPLVLIPLWQHIYNAARADRIAYAMAIALYVLAKGAELGDHAIAAFFHDTFGLTFTGHTIKHLLATAAAAVLVLRLLIRVDSQTTLRPHRPALPGGAGQRSPQSGRPA